MALISKTTRHLVFAELKLIKKQSEWKKTCIVWNYIFNTVADRDIYAVLNLDLKSEKQQLLFHVGGKTVISISLEVSFSLQASAAHGWYSLFSWGRTNNHLLSSSQLSHSRT